jgi:hypothetical protein
MARNIVESYLMQKESTEDPRKAILYIPGMTVFGANNCSTAIKSAIMQILKDTSRLDDPVLALHVDTVSTMLQSCSNELFCCISQSIIVDEDYGPHVDTIKQYSLLLFFLRFQYIICFTSVIISLMLLKHCWS